MRNKKKHGAYKRKIKMDAQAQQQMQQIQQQQQQQSSTKVFTVVETRHLLKILMNPKTLALFKDNKQSHSFVWNYIYKCMKLKFPKFAKSTRQCYKKYENLKGKYFEIKRAQLAGEQRPYWLYYNEMDYIISHFPGHRPRINTLESATNAAAAAAAASNTPNTNSTTPTSEGSNSATNLNAADVPETKTLRSTTHAVAAANLDTSAGDTAVTTFIPKKLQLLTIIRNTKPAEFEKKSDGWELVLKKAQNKGLFPLNRTWLDFYYEIWVACLDETIAKWEAFTSGSRIVRYDEADKIMFDIIKDDWNDYSGNSSGSIRIPTLRTLPTYLEKLKDLRQENLLEEIDSILPEQTDDDQNASVTSASNNFLSNNKAIRNLENGHNFDTTHLNDTPNVNLSNLFSNESPLIQYKQQTLQLKNQFIKTKMSAYVEKHNRKCYKMDLELYKIEKELGLPPSEFTQKFAQQQHQQQQQQHTQQQQQQQQIVTGPANTANMTAMTAPIPSMHPHPQQQQTTQQIITNNIGGGGPQIQSVNSVNGANGTGNPQSVHINDTFFNVDIKREMNFDDGGNFDFV